MLFFILAITQAPQVIVKEPRPANPWTETFQASCGNQTLEVKRHIRPLGKSAEVRLNGEIPIGNVTRLVQDLSELTAVYRMSLVCQQGGDGMYFRWVRGDIHKQGGVTYSVGAAFFRGGKLVNVHRKDDIEADNLWYH